MTIWLNNDNFAVLMRLLEEHEFHCLDLKDKITLATLLGMHLMSILDGDYRIRLYHFHNFYVEIWEDTAKDEVLHARTFVNIRGLSPYLAKVGISQIRLILDNWP